MNNIDESFSNINTISFLLEQLQNAVDDQDMNAIVDITHALNAFLPIYTSHWDKQFKLAWTHVIDHKGETPWSHPQSGIHKNVSV